MAMTNHPGPMTLKNYLNLEKYGIPPDYGIPLVIISADSPKFSFNAINIESGWAYDGQTLILWSLSPGTISWNSVWQLTPQGLIVCPRYPGLVIGISAAGGLCLVGKDDSDASVNWTLTAYKGGYTITNTQTSQAITATQLSVLSGSGTQNGAIGLTDIANQTPVSNQLWKFIPPGVLPSNSFYLQSGLSGQPGQAENPMVATSSSSNNLVYAQAWEPGSADQLWRFNADGTISQADDLSESLVLTSTSTNSTSDNSVEMQPINGTPTDLQIWTYHENNNYLSITSAATGTINLNVNDGKTSNPLITYGSDDSNSEWYIFPEQSTLPGEWFYIQTLLNQNPSDPPGPAYVLTVASGEPVAGTSIQVNQLQANALTQLWQLQSDGTLVSALNPSLVLSASTTDGGAVTLQQAKDSAFKQYWCVMPNGMLATPNGTTAYYLSILNTVNPYQSSGNGSNPMLNAEVVVYCTSIVGKSMGQWEILPYEPDISGQWFTIESVNSHEKESSPYLLSVGNDWTSLKVLPPLGSNILKYGTAGINQLWQFTLDGNIVSALNPQLYLTGVTDKASNAVTLTLAPEGSTGQRWVWGETWKTDFTYQGKQHTVQSAVLLNSSLNYALYADQSGSDSTVSLQPPASPASSVPNQCWYMLPLNPAFNQPTTIRNQGGVDKLSGLFLQLQESSTGTSPAYTVIVGERGSKSDLSTWEFVYPGYIASSVNSDIVLSLEGTPGTTRGTTTYGPGIMAYPRLVGEQAFQLWEADQQGLLINRQNGQALMVVVDDSVTPNTYSVTTIPPQELSGTNLPFWDFSPGQALQTVLIMPPIPFPVGASGSDDDQYYTEISNYLGLPGGIREQYQNLAAPLASYQLEISQMPVPIDSTTNAPSEAFISVASQISKEITKVIAIQQFFNQIGAFHQAFSQAQALLVSELITACAFPNGQATPVAPPKKKRAWLWDIGEGILYTTLNIISTGIGDPGVGKQLTTLKGLAKNGLPVLANVFSCALTTKQAKNQSAPSSNSQYSKALQNAYNYELTVFQLQQSLLNLFEEVGNMLGKMEMAILVDWGKITAVYDMIKSTGTIDSLFWPASMAPSMTQNMLAGYATKVLQTLIPANPNFYINGYLNGYAPGTDNLGLQQDQITFYGKDLDTTVSKWQAEINPDVMSQVWGYGTNPNDFYRQLNGWDILVKYPYGSNISGISGSNAALIMIFYNQTSVDMTLDLSGMGGQTLSPGLLDLPAYGATQYAGHAYVLTTNVIQGPSGTLTIYEKGNPDNVVLTDTITQYDGGKNENPSFTTGLVMTSPYYMVKGAKNPNYVVNLTVYDIYIGMGVQH